MNNILYFYNMGTRASNVGMFKSVMKLDFGIEETQLERIMSGYEFILDDENREKCRVLFFDNGSQLMTVFQGNNTEDVVKVYKAFDNRFFEE